VGKSEFSNLQTVQLVGDPAHSKHFSLQATTYPSSFSINPSIGSQLGNILFSPQVMQLLAETSQVAHYLEHLTTNPLTSTYPGRAKHVPG